MVAHQCLSEIITSFYPNDVEDDNIINVRSSFSSLNNSNQAVADFLECITLLTSVRQDLRVVLEKVNSARLTELSSELVHHDTMGERVIWCQEAEKHLRTVAENKDLLIYHLQQPLVTNYLTMHYQYHRNLITLVEELDDILNRVEVHVRLVEDHAQNSTLQRADSGISNIARTMTELRNTLDNIVSLQSIVTEMTDVPNQDIGPSI